MTLIDWFHQWICS